MHAALSMPDGKVIGQRPPRHRSQEFIRFLRHIDQETPTDLGLNLIVDNVITSLEPARGAMAETPQAFPSALHPHGGSRSHMIKKWFGEITQKRFVADHSKASPS